MRKHETDAARRSAHEITRAPRKHGKSGRSATKSRDGFFVAWDGEGVNRDTKILVLPRVFDRTPDFFADCEQEIQAVAKDVYDSEVYDHNMTLFAYSDEGGNHHGTLYNDGATLSSMEILSFILAAVQHCGRLAIHVSFAFTYDATHILRDIPREEVVKAYSDKRRKIDDYCRFGPFLIKYRPRKELYIAKLRDPARPYREDGRKGFDLEASVTIWDTIGFFQTSFITALRLWNAADNADLATVEAGKIGRADFQSWSIEEIIRYNDLELVLLCRMMDKLRSALHSSDLHLARWDGAGAVATAVYKKELPKDYMRSISLPIEVQTASYHAYAGGRSECIQQGHYIGDIWRSDLNSAYPHAMRLIPDLSSGEWLQMKGSYYDLAYGFPDIIQDFALYHIRWNDLAITDGDTAEKYDPHYEGPSEEIKNTPFLPFFWRDDMGCIFYPAFGENWVWGCELREALQYNSSLMVEILEGLEFKPYGNHRPFQFIERYYEERLAIKERSERGEASEADQGRSIVLKLGLNSLYGKTIQKVGAKINDDGSITLPPFYNITIGSYITAKCRAMLYSRAAINPSSIILFATDGILSTAPLSADVSSSTLGEWETKRFHGVTMLQAGIYWLYDGNKWIEKSRGIDRALNQEEVDQRHTTILELWKRRHRYIYFTLKRFLGAKYCALTENRWNLRGAWINDVKAIELYNGGKKRITLDRSRVMLDTNLYRSEIAYPDHNIEYGITSLSKERSLPIFTIEDEQEED